jgi:hypothetical protein
MPSVAERYLGWGFGSVGTWMGSSTPPSDRRTWPRQPRTSRRSIRRTYAINYAAGLELCRSYVAGEPERFRHLLTEQVRVRDLLASAE